MRRSVLLAVSVLALVTSATGCLRIVEKGEVGVVTSFGDIQPDEKTEPGLYLSVPLMRHLEIYNVKTIETKETMQVPTADEMLVGLDVSVFVRLDPARVAELRSSVTGNAMETLLIPTLRSQTREAAGGFKVEDFYNQEKRVQISSEMYGMNGCRSTRMWSSTQAAIARVSSFAASSSPESTGFASSRYQSQKVFQTKR